MVRQLTVGVNHNDKSSDCRWCTTNQLNVSDNITPTHNYESTKCTLDDESAKCARDNESAKCTPNNESPKYASYISGHS